LWRSLRARGNTAFRQGFLQDCEREQKIVFVFIFNALSGIERLRISECREPQEIRVACA
jgi:hypothetical protein